MRGALVKGEREGLRALLVGAARRGGGLRGGPRRGGEERGLDAALLEPRGLAAERVDELRRARVERAVMRMFAWRTGRVPLRGPRRPRRARPRARAADRDRGAVPGDGGDAARRRGSTSRSATARARELAGSCARAPRRPPPTPSLFERWDRSARGGVLGRRAATGARSGGADSGPGARPARGRATAQQIVLAGAAEVRARPRIEITPPSPDGGTAVVAIDPDLVALERLKAALERPLRAGPHLPARRARARADPPVPARCRAPARGDLQPSARAPPSGGRDGTQARWSPAQRQAPRMPLLSRSRSLPRLRGPDRGRAAAAASSARPIGLSPPASSGRKAPPEAASPRSHLARARLALPRGPGAGPAAAAPLAKAALRLAGQRALARAGVARRHPAAGAGVRGTSASRAWRCSCCATS